MSAVFCRDHAYYNCPVCRGEDLAWVIPIEKDGEIVGELRIPQEGEPEITGALHIPWERGPSPFRDVPVYVPAPVAEDPPRRLLEQPEDTILFPSTFDRLTVDERWRDAAARGRAVYDRACALAEAQAIPYEEALEAVLKGR